AHSEEEPRPRLVDRGYLRVDEPARQPRLTDDVLREVRSEAGRLLRPGDPERSAESRDPLSAQVARRAHEPDREVDASARAPAESCIRRAEELLEPVGCVDEGDSGLRFDSELLRQRRPRVAGVHERLTKSIETGTPSSPKRSRSWFSTQ